MDANTITAVCATGIAVASLAVSVTEARASRRHNRQSVRPLLQFEFERQSDEATGIRLANHGLGPAVVTGTRATLDGELLGTWEEPAVNRLRANLPVRPRVMTLRDGKVVPAGFVRFLLYLPQYRDEADVWFWHLIRHRLTIEIRYESLYGRDEQRIQSLPRRSGVVPRRDGPDPAPEAATPIS